GVTEDRTEHAKVVTPAVATAQDRLLGQLVAEADTRRPVQRVPDAAIETDAANASHPNERGRDVDSAAVHGRQQEAAVLSRVDRLRIDDVESQTVVGRQLLRATPGVLHVVRAPPLALGRVYCRTDIPIEPADLTEEERREAQSPAIGTLRLLRIEVELAGPMPVARHAQVPGSAHIDAELDRVVLDEAGDVRDKLHLLLVLIERAVAAVHPQARAEVEPPIALPDRPAS